VGLATLPLDFSYDFSMYVSAKDSSGEVVGHPIITKNTSRTKSTMAMSLKVIQRDNFPVNTMPYPVLRRTEHGISSHEALPDAA
jgi:hypothetical protein